MVLEGASAGSTSAPSAPTSGAPGTPAAACAGSTSAAAAGAPHGSLPSGPLDLSQYTDEQIHDLETKGIIAAGSYSLRIQQREFAAMMQQFQAAQAAQGLHPTLAPVASAGSTSAAAPTPVAPPPLHLQLVLVQPARLRLAFRASALALLDAASRRSRTKDQLQCQPLQPA